MLRGSVISFDWYKSAEGQGLLTQLTDPNTGYRKLYGLLEQPSLPPSLPVHQFKLFLVGRPGSGKTCLVSWLAGLPGWNYTVGESPGVRVTQIYWPCLLTPRPGSSPHIATFKLHFWDAGDSAVRKYSHHYPDCREGAAAVILTFSFTDRTSWEELPALIQRTLAAGAGEGVGSILPIVVGTKFGHANDNEVSQQEVMEAESNWNIPIIKVRHAGLVTNQGAAPSNLPEVASALNTICEQLWLASHRGNISADC